MIKLKDVREIVFVDLETNSLCFDYSIWCDSKEGLAYKNKIPLYADAGHTVSRIADIRKRAIDTLNERYIGGGYSSFERLPDLPGLKSPAIMKDPRLNSDPSGLA